MNISQEQLETLHQRQLGIMKEIQRICIGNGIQYFAIAGTLLGAVRHRGFIPWDDDIDIGMLRSDYEKFLRCASGQLSPGHFLQTWHSDAGFGLPMAKIRLDNTRVVEAASANANCHQGIFVDIFPFDEKPNSSIARLIHGASVYVLKRVLLARSGYSVGIQSSTFVRTAFGILTTILKVAPKKRLIELLEFLMTKPNGSNSDSYVTVAGSYGYRKESLKRTWAGEFLHYNFEELELPGFKDVDAYLRHMYGEYAHIPPLHKRIDRHDILHIDFGS